MTFNPVVFCLFLYAIANGVALFQGLSAGGLVLEGRFFYLENSSLIISYIIQFFFLVFLFFCYHLFRRGRTNRKEFVLRSNWGYFLIVVQVLFLIFNLLSGVNIAGGDNRGEGSVLKYFFVLLQVDILYILISISTLSNKIFWLNTWVYVFSMLLRGWMGGVFIVLLLISSRFYPLSMTRRSLFGFLISIMLVFIFLPVIIDAKWSMRLGVPFLDFVSGINNSFALDKYVSSFSYVINRFQHVGHVALIYENSLVLSERYNQDFFVSYWMDGLPQYLFSKMLGLETYRLNSYMVEYFFGINAPTWNTNPGLAGWFFVAQENILLFLIYLFFIIFFPFFFIRKYASHSMLLIVSCFSFIYLFHGWFGAYFNLIFYMLLFVFVNRIKLLPQTNR